MQALMDVFTKQVVHLLFIVMIFCYGKAHSQQTLARHTDITESTDEEGETYILSPVNAHPHAKALLTEKFYWNDTDESCPFGNDDGADAFYAFRQWRISNKDSSPVLFLKELIKSWGYPQFDLNETNAQAIGQYISLHPMGDMSLLGQDNAIIAVAFGQLILEGRIVSEMQALSRAAIRRQLLPLLLNPFEEEYRALRIDKLNRMLQTLNKLDR